MLLTVPDIGWVESDVLRKSFVLLIFRWVLDGLPEGDVSGIIRTTRCCGTVHEELLIAPLPPGTENAHGLSCLHKTAPLPKIDLSILMVMVKAFETN